jgi:hypothetical protein
MQGVPSEQKPQGSATVAEVGDVSSGRETGGRVNMLVKSISRDSWGSALIRLFDPPGERECERFSAVPWPPAFSVSKASSMH